MGEEKDIKLEEGETAQEAQASNVRAAKRGSKKLAVGIAAGSALALACVGICLAVFSGGAGTTGEPSDAPPVQDAEAASDLGSEEAEPEDGAGDAGTSEEDHEHIWVPVYGLEHHDARTHTVDHPAEYADETTYHTVCNDCKQIIDGKADAHIESTGHGGYSTNVPIVNQVLSEQGWTETVVDEEAYDEVTVTGEKCSICNATREVETRG